MTLTNPTPYPALVFEGIDQLGQMFHVIAMRQTYTWDDTGLLIATNDQRPVRLADQLIDPDDVMSGIIEESDLAHYKPKCDIIIQGHAYPPKQAHGKPYFVATLSLQRPNSVILAKKDQHQKYAHIKLHSQSKNKDTLSEDYLVKGESLISKTLNIHSPSQAVISNDQIMGMPYYRLKTTGFNLKSSNLDNSNTQKVSINPQNSFGGYCFIEQTDPNLINLIKLDKDIVIPADERDFRLNPYHDPIVYFDQNDYNPYGTGYSSPIYLQAIKPNIINLPQVQPIESSKKHKKIKLVEAINQMVKSPLESDIYNQLTVGFGVRCKSHPDRNKFIGKIDGNFKNNGKLLPEGFNFAVWNSAYPDQQTDFLKGNEWLTLTNLCSAKTVASQLTKQGDTKLTLYLPESLAYLSLTSSNPDITDADMPMKLDTLIVRPDKQEVTLVWRAIIVGDYELKSATLAVLEKQEQDALIKDHFTRLAWLDRPYKEYQ